MRFTILGSSGFIGSHLVNELNKSEIECFTPSKEYEFTKNENLGHIIYCIGLTADFRTRPMDTVKAHVCKLMEVLENTSFDSFMYLSSTRVYNDSMEGKESSSLLVNPNNLSDLCNISKLMGEAVCFAFPNEKIRVVRLSNVIGNDFSSDNFLFSLIKSAVDSNEIKLGVPKEASKDYITIDDVLSLIQKIALNGNERLYNISSGQSISNKLIVDEIARYTNCKIEFLDSSNNLNFPLIQNNKIKEEFNFIPKNVLDEIKILIDKYKKLKDDTN